MNKKTSKGLYPYHVKLYWSKANSLESWLRRNKAEFAFGLDVNDKCHNIIYFGDSAYGLVMEWAEKDEKFCKTCGLCKITGALEVHKSEVLEVV